MSKERLGIFSIAVGLATVLSFAIDLPGKIKAYIIGPEKSVNVVNNYNSETKNYPVVTRPTEGNPETETKTERTTDVIQPEVIPPLPENQHGKPEPTIEKINIDDYINNRTSKNDIAVIIIDTDKKLVSGLTASISKIYSDKGLRVTTSLFTDEFLRSPYLNKLENGNLKLIEDLFMPSYVKYVVIGRYFRAFMPSKGPYTIKCTGHLDVKIISCVEKAVVGGFDTDPLIGSRNDEANAENDMKLKLIEYCKYHLESDNPIKQ